MPAALQAFLQDVFKIRPEEAKRTGLAFVYLFAAIGAFIIGRITRTVLFLEIPDYKQLLPLAYIGTAIAVSSSMFIYARVERRLRRDYTNAVTLGLLIAVTLAFRFLLEAGAVVYWAFYFWVEIYGTFLVVQFWSFANEIFHSRQAKRLFAVIGGGGVLANVAIGLAISGTVKSLGTENLLYVISGCFAVSLLLVLALGRNSASELNAARAKAPASRGKGAAPAAATSIFATRHVQLVALVVVLTYLVSTLVDYQFQAIIGDSIPGKDERGAYLGQFFAYTGIIAGVIQFFFTSRILESFGLLVALILLPSAMLMGSVGLLTVPLISGLWAVAFTKGSENCLRYTVNDSTLQLLYLPLPAHLRGRAKATIDGILKPVSIGGAGLLMALLVGSLESLTGFSLGFKVDSYSLSWAVVGGLALWITALLGLRREYVKSLLQTLQRRRLNFAEASFSINDEQTIKTLETALTGGRIGEVLHALELVGSVSPKGRAALDAKVVELLHHESDDVQVAALAHLRRVGASLHAEDVAKLLDDNAGEVRASAVLTFAAIEKERSIGRAQKLLDDPDVRVRAAAVAAFIRYGGLDGVLASAEQLKKMLGSSDARERERAAWALGEIGVPTFYGPLMPLLEDPDERVRITAIEATGRLRNPELLVLVVQQLSRPQLAGPAVATIAAYGPAGLEVASRLLGDEAQAPEVRAQATKVLARLGDAGASELLTKHLRDASLKVRTAAVQSLATLVNHNPGIRVDARIILAALRDESKLYFELVTLEHDLDLGQAAPLLADAIAHRKKQATTRMLALLGLKYPTQTIDLVARNMQSAHAATRGNSVEVLDNMLAKDEKAVVVPVVDDLPPARLLQVGRELFGLERVSRAERLRGFLGGEDSWLRVCAATAVGDLGLKELAGEVRQMLSGEDSVGRETALCVLQKLRVDESLRESVEGLVGDPVGHVSRYARHVLRAMS